jgi:hypothetical protein
MGFSIPNVPMLLISLGYEGKQFTANQLFTTEKNCNELLLKTSNEELNQVLISVCIQVYKIPRWSTVLNTNNSESYPA